MGRRLRDTAAALSPCKGLDNHIRIVTTRTNMTIERCVLLTLAAAGPSPAALMASGGAFFMNIRTSTIHAIKVRMITNGKP